MGLVWVTTQVMRPDRPLQRGFPGVPKTRKGFVRSAGGCRDGRGARIPAHGCMHTRAAAHARVRPGVPHTATGRSEEHTSELQSRGHLVCRLLLEKKKRRHRSTQM